jgi:hypothetical protein
LRCASAELVAVADPSEIAQTAMRSIVPGIKSYGTPEDWLGAWKKFRRVSNNRFFVACHGLGMKNTE